MDVTDSAGSCKVAVPSAIGGLHRIKTVRLHSLEPPGSIMSCD